MTGLLKEQDAYGHGVLAFLQGDASTEVVERDDGLIEPDNGPAGYFQPYRSWPAIERRAMRYVRGRVLDVEAGAGRVALHVQEQRLDVVAIDNSPLAVKVCLLRGVKDAPVVPFTQVSAKLGVFDTVVMFGNNFGLFGSFERARWMLRRLKIRVRYLSYATPWFDYLFVSQAEMRKIVAGTGWQVTRVIEKAPRYVAVIEKET